MTELLILAAIAVVVLYRLYTVLGRQNDAPSASGVSSPERAAADAQAEAYESASPIREEVEGPAKAIADVDPEFSPSEFLRGARDAYKMIVAAYGEGDLARVRPFLATDVRKAFEAGVKERAANKQNVELEVERIDAADIVDARVEGDRAAVDVRFDALVFEAVRDEENRVVAGDATEAAQRRETWTFERSLKTDDPNWILTATGA